MQEIMTGAEVAALRRGEHVPPRPAKRPPQRLEITIPIPPAATRPNARGHWAKKANAVKKQREAAGIAAKLALMNGPYDPPRWERAQVQATFYRAKCYLPMDSDNAVSWLKSSYDSLQDSGIILNDRGLTHLPPVQLLGADAGGETKVVLVVEPLNS